MKKLEPQIFYSPTHNYFGLLFVQYIILVVTLLGVSYVYGNWMPDTMKGLPSVLLMFVVIFTSFWFYRVQKLWIFKWEGEEVKVFLKVNLLAFNWVHITISERRVISKLIWKPKFIEIDENILYEEKMLPCVLIIKKTTERYKVGCSIVIDNEPLKQ